MSTSTVSPCARCWEYRLVNFLALKGLIFHCARKRWEIYERFIFKQFVSYIFK